LLRILGVVGLPLLLDAGSNRDLHHEPR
jgi:hypothetical protein